MHSTKTFVTGDGHERNRKHIGNNKTRGPRLEHPSRTHKSTTYIARACTPHYCSESRELLAHVRHVASLHKLLPRVLCQSDRDAQGRYPT
eukprot:7511101-Heterocapsa_arctica.AAC.1